MDSSQAQSKRLSLRPEWRDNRLSFVASIKPNSPHDAVKSPTMEQSPLVQQTRPDVFEPKVVGLYKQLFRVNESSRCFCEVNGNTSFRISKTRRNPKASGASCFSLTRISPVYARSWTIVTLST